MTEDEAKTKWCPFVVASHTNPRQRAWVDGDDGEPTGALHHNCLGGECMAWRWSEGVGRCRVSPDVVPSWKGWVITDAAPDERGYVEIFKPQTDGYCGLAGAPQ